MKILQETHDVTPRILEAVEETLDWFPDGPLPADEFIDRLCDVYGGDDWDIEDYYNPAVRKILRHARKVRVTT